MLAQDLPLETLHCRPDKRSLNEAAIPGLVDSIREIGLINPLRVRQDGDGWEIIAGAHRYEAARRIGLAAIPCIVYDNDDIHAELVMIDENLMRVDLRPSERAQQTVRRKEIYEILHPETKHGGDRVSEQVDNLSTCSFADATAKATGKDPRTVRRDAERGEKVIDEVLDLIRGTPIDTGAYLDKIKKLPPNEQFVAATRDLKESREKPKPKRSPRKKGPSGRKVVRLDENKLKIDQAEYLAERLVDRFTSEELPSILEALRDTDTAHIVSAIKKLVDTPIMDRQFA